MYDEVLRALVETTAGGINTFPSAASTFYDIVSPFGRFTEHSLQKRAESDYSELVNNTPTDSQLLIE